MGGGQGMLAGVARSLLPLEDQALRTVGVVLLLPKDSSRLAEPGWEEACL